MIAGRNRHAHPEPARRAYSGPQSSKYLLGLVCSACRSRRLARNKIETKFEAAKTDFGIVLACRDASQSLGHELFGTNRSRKMGT
jgi:hypothetical protein